MQVREPRRVGGRFDTLTGCFVGPCTEWAVWYVGVKQYEILFNPRTQHSLIYSAEGAGKTVTMAMWIWLQIIAAAASGVTGAIGATAPTAKRLGTLQRAVTDLAPISSSRDPLSEGAWGTLFADAGEIQTCSGHLIQFRATKRQSGAVGSPVQGYTWHLGAAVDEAQDQVGAMPDIIARTRGGATPPIFATATAKDSPDWRTYRDSLNSDYWTIYRISYLDAWAVHRSYWDMFKANCPPREWQRRGLALDVGPERMTYNTWEREHNLKAVPLIGAEDVTAQVLARYGKNCRILVGRDPGSSVQVSTFLKAFKLKDERRHRWYVVDEVSSVRATEEQHLADVRVRLHLHKCNPGQDYGQPVVKFDPTTKPEVYTLYRRAGIIARPANYKMGSNKAATIPKESRIDMVCTLFCNANNERWLYIAADEHGRPIPTKTVESVELSERDAAYQAEAVKKGDGDVTHWMASVGYALWAEEKPRLEPVGGAIGRLTT